MAYSRQTVKIIEALRNVPYGRVDTYGNVALRAGYPGAARQVVRVLNSLSVKEALPWHRIVNREGSISLNGEGKKEQEMLLLSEGISLINDRIDIRIYGI